MKMRISRTSVNSNAVNSEQVFVKGDEGGNSCVQSDGYMVSVSGKQVVLPHQSKGKVTAHFRLWAKYCPSFQFGSDGFHPRSWLPGRHVERPSRHLPIAALSFLPRASKPASGCKRRLVVNEIAHNANQLLPLATYQRSLDTQGGRDRPYRNER